MKNRLSVLFENDTLLAVEKPSGMLSVPDRFHEDKPSVSGLILQTFPSARPLHRLDFETSGVLLYCLRSEAFGWYSDQFEQRTVIKEYLALVEGRVREDEGIIDAPLFTLETGKVIISKKGRPSRTEWKVTERFKSYTLVEAHPLTGRTHQIRVHLASIGHPVAGDTIYGSKGAIFLSDVKGRKRYKLGKDVEEERPMLGRLALHAYGISILDFKTHDAIEIPCPLPKDMQVAVNKLRQWASL